MYVCILCICICILCICIIQYHFHYTILVFYKIFFYFYITRPNKKTYVIGINQTNLLSTKIMSSFQQKAAISVWSAGTFALLNAPMTYRLTNKFLTVKTYKDGCPTAMGSLIHTMVFFLVSFLSMVIGGGNTSVRTMLDHSLYGSLIYFFVSSPPVYSVTKSFFSKTSNSSGCPTLTGVMLHSFVYFVLLMAVMYL